MFSAPAQGYSYPVIRPAESVDPFTGTGCGAVSEVAVHLLVPLVLAGSGSR